MHGVAMNATEAMRAKAAYDAGPSASMPASPSIHALERLDRLATNTAVMRDHLTALAHALGGPFPPDPQGAASVSRMEPKGAPEGLLPRTHALLDMIEANLNQCGAMLTRISTL
jgi:hypothetical protein